MSDISEIKNVVIESQNRLAQMLGDYLSKQSLTVDAYQRYLSMQYHLTKGVQRYFMNIAAHEDLAKMKSLRAWLVNFSDEEEHHYLIAESDLNKLNLPILPMPFDVTLWHAHFKSIVTEKPFVRLGAACVLENLAGGNANKWTHEALKADFLTKENTKFIVIHQHEVLPHGDQIFSALEQVSLTQEHIQDLVLGAKQATVMFLRMIEWVFNPECLSVLANNGKQQL